MRTDVKKIDDGRTELEVKLSLDEFKPYFEEALKEETKKVTLQGFRAGKAPKEMVYGAVDQDKAAQKAAEKAIKKTLREESEKRDWKIIETPEITVLDMQKEFVYKAKFIVMPEIKLPDYRKIAAEENKAGKERLEKIKVSEEEVGAAIEWLKKSRQKEEDKDEQKKETRDNEITDEEAKEYGDFKTVEELKKSIREGIEMEKKLREADYGRAAIVNKIVKKIKLDLPQIMVDRMAEAKKKELKENLERGGKIKFEDYIKEHFKKESELEKQLKEKAAQEIKSQLILNKISEEEKLSPTQEEVQAKSQMNLQQLPEEYKKSIDIKQLYDYSYGQIQNEKVFKFLESLN